MIRLESVDRMSKTEADRFLVDPVWPKALVRSIPHKEAGGQRRPELARIRWFPALSPSAALWTWFRHSPDKAARFQDRYFRELEKKKKIWSVITNASDEGGAVLLYHGKDAHQTPVPYLKEFLDRKSRANRVPRSGHTKHPGLPGQGVAPPVEKAISRKRRLPLKEEMRFAPEQKLTPMPPENRRILR